ncbi:DedA family protein [Cellulosimicrobium cellulans]|uniref:DedA family protein n=1 Tax=Cellulosimicrobium cellulans TaxID=1710 RepID=UPI0035E1F6DD
MTALLAEIDALILAAAAHPWAAAVLLLCCIIDGFFPVVPSESLVIAMATTSVHTGPVPWWAIILIAASGALIGDLIAYTIGRHIPLERMHRLREGRGRTALDWAQRQLRSRAGLFILTARYIPVGRVAVNMAAGATRFPLHRFIRYDAIAVLAWASYNTAIGATAAHLFDNTLVSITVGIAGGLLIGALVDHITRRRALTTSSN